MSFAPGKGRTPRRGTVLRSIHVRSSSVPGETLHVTIRIVGRSFIEAERLAVALVSAAVKRCGLPSR